MKSDCGTEALTDGLLLSLLHACQPSLEPDGIGGACDNLALDEST